ncbi:MAG: ferrochelatase [Alphaproteobacteria bacterium]|jgi:protoporphyrin/coproporphyrin ferrochelatase|nr:ferrochelatase [Alphaproteobacteria bacterium]
MSKIAIILFNLGGPDGPSAVQPFLFNLFNDKAIIGVPQPIRWFIAKLISTRRAPIAQKIYEQLGGGSPLVPNTKKQANALQMVLQERYVDDDVKCFMAMRYWHPMADEVAADVKAWGADEVILLPLYPQYSTTTSGSSIKDWERASKNAHLNAITKGICCYPIDFGFISAVVERLKIALVEAENNSNIRILFSAHGLPKKIVDKGDPYKEAVERTAAAVMDRLDAPELDWRVSYQSRVGPLEWIKPYTEDEIRLAGVEGMGLIVVPIAFVSEHSETLVELDIEYRELAEDAGVASYTRVGTVADDKLFINGLADLVSGARSRNIGLSGPEGRRICSSDCLQCPISE